MTTADHRDMKTAGHQGRKTVGRLGKKTGVRVHQGRRTGWGHRDRKRRTLLCVTELWGEIQ